MLIEEAHHFAPHGQEAVSTAILKQTLAEGRKFGIGVGLITQRPGKLDARCAQPVPDAVHHAHRQRGGPAARGDRR